MKYTLPQLGKAIAAFVVPLLINMGLDLAKGTAPWPQTQEEWIRYVAFSVLSALGVFFTKSETTPDQITRIANKKPAVVVQGVTASNTAPEIAKAVVAVEVAEAVEAVEVAEAVEAVDEEEADRVVDEVMRERGEET